VNGREGVREEEKLRGRGKQGKCFWGSLGRGSADKGDKAMATKAVKVTLPMVLAAIEEDNNLGFCLVCGAEASGVEPDAREYQCEGCGQRKVYGAEELLFMLA
jgi:hypothetical protein